MDRISALRNVEEALAAFEAGDTDLAGLERQVRGILRTYATDFEGELAAYRASGHTRVDGMVVLASTEQEARERVRALLEGDEQLSSDFDFDFDIERLSEHPGGAEN